MRRLRSHLAFHLLRVLIVRLDDMPPTRREHPELRYAALTQEDVVAWCTDAELELDEERAKAALRRGDVCIGVSDAGRPVGYVWFAFGATPSVQGLHPSPVPRPRHRTANVPARQPSSARAAAARSASSPWTSTTPGDSAHRGARAGTPVGVAGFWRFCGWILPYRSPGARSYGFAFFGAPATAY